MRMKAISPEHQQWLDEQLRKQVEEREAKEKMNPCTRVYGLGPKDKTCKSCKHLIAKRFSRTYYKCEFRRNTNGPATDHKVSFEACGKFVDKFERVEAP